MHRFDEEDHEPVAVVRTLSDFALALTLVVLMLIGTRSAIESQAASRATTSEGNGPKPELTLLLTNPTHFAIMPNTNKAAGLSAAAVADSWRAAHPGSKANIVLEFEPQALATALHRALLQLQAAFGTNLVQIQTVPAP